MSLNVLQECYILSKSLIRYSKKRHWHQSVVFMVVQKKEPKKISDINLFHYSLIKQECKSLKYLAKFVVRVFRTKVMVFRSFSSLRISGYQVKKVGQEIVS